MPFDGTGFEEGPRKPSPPTRTQKVWASIIVALAFILLVFPVSAEGLVDVIRYLQSR